MMAPGAVPRELSFTFPSGSLTGSQLGGLGCQDPEAGQMSISSERPESPNSAAKDAGAGQGYSLGWGRDRPGSATHLGMI